jgi:predicted nucleotidyltransferase
MRRDAALAILQAHATELKRLGVLSVSLFGSAARDEAGEDSDIDLAVRLTEGPRGSPHLKRMEHLREVLSDMLGRPVDVVEEPTSRPRIQAEIERDRQRAF